MATTGSGRRLRYERLFDTKGVSQSDARTYLPTPEVSIRDERLFDTKGVSQSDARSDTGGVDPGRTPD